MCRHLFFLLTAWCAFVQVCVYCICKGECLLLHYESFFTSPTFLSPPMLRSKTKDVSLKSIKNPLGDLKSMNI